MAVRRIRGKYRSRYEPEVPTVRAIIRFPKLRSATEVHFLIDTGAANATLMPSDFGELGLDFSGSQMYVASGIGGAMRYFLETAQIELRTEGNVADYIGLNLAIAQPSASNLILPSLLGRDALQYLPPRLRWAPA